MSLFYLLWFYRFYGKIALRPISYPQKCLWQKCSWQRCLQGKYRTWWDFEVGTSLRPTRGGSGSPGFLKPLVTLVQPESTGWFGNLVAEWRAFLACAPPEGDHPQGVETPGAGSAQQGGNSPKTQVSQPGGRLPRGLRGESCKDAQPWSCHPASPAKGSGSHPRRGQSGACTLWPGDGRLGSAPCWLCGFRQVVTPV